jgi:cytoskeletal protein CcmA (bactofilin family)
MFSKKQESAVRTSGNGAMADPSFSVLGPDIAIKGDLTATMDLHLDGRIDGDIKCAALVQGASSEVTGAVIAENARIAGTIRGSITADILVILKSARIDGDISYGSLTVEEGAQVNGKFTPRSAEPKLMLAGGTEAS